MATIIDGKLVSNEIREQLKTQVEELKKNGKSVGLGLILVGEDPASQVYVKNKIKACEYVGIESYCYRMDVNSTQEEVLEVVDKLNKDDKVNGILVQLPLPKHLDEKVILDRIDVKKDVDGFSAYQIGKMVLGEKSIVSCTPKGIIELLKYYKIDIAGKNAVVIGRSNIVGKPISMLLLKENATVTICHSRTQNLAEICAKADILVVAIGKAKFVKNNMVKNGAVIIDVGINRDEDGKLCGDVDFEDVVDKCSYITPVPGGVGPMTVTMLLKNTLEIANG